jgi:hypothetical protein
LIDYFDSIQEGKLKVELLINFNLKPIWYSI